MVTLAGLALVFEIATAKLKVAETTFAVTVG
jgi:hypothetical protein